MTKLRINFKKPRTKLMSRDYTSYTMEELEAAEKEIRAKCRMWESSTDGSHGYALHNAGITEVLEELERRTNND